MDKTGLHLGLIHLDALPAEFFDDFRETIDAPGLALEMRARENQPFAGVEWLLPTAVVLYVTRSYFDAFLKEAGKDHYLALKAGVKSLWERVRPVKVTVMGTPGKVGRDQPYSLAFSVVSEVADGNSIKLLLPNNLDEEASLVALDALLDFLDAFYGDGLDDDILALLNEARVVGRTLLVAFNPVTQRVEPIDPMTRSFTALSAKEPDQAEGE